MTSDVLVVIVVGAGMVTKPWLRITMHANMPIQIAYVYKFDVAPLAYEIIVAQVLFANTSLPLLSFIALQRVLRNGLWQCVRHADTSLAMRLHPGHAFDLMNLWYVIGLGYAFS